MYIRLLTTVSIFIFKTSCSQEITKVELLKKSMEYYQSLNVFSVQVVEHSKPSIKIDTSTWVYECFVDKLNSSEYFASGSGKTAYFVKNSKEFAIYPLEERYQEVKYSQRKKWIYFQKYSLLPFINFEKFMHRISNTAKPITTDSSYQLQDVNTIYEFDNKDFSIKNIIRIETENLTGGTSFESVNFQITINDDLKVKEKLSYAEYIISSNSSREKVIVNNVLQQFDLSFFNQSNLTWHNSKPDLYGKTILIDFFYQGCYPCLKSYPYLEEAHKNRDSSYIVIGIDTQPGDTLHLKKYLDKYKITFPVLAGLEAQKLASQMNISFWPTMVLLNSKGEVLLYQRGFTPAMFLRLKQKLQ